MLAPAVLMKCSGGANLSVSFADSSPWEGKPMGVAWTRLLPQGRESCKKHSQTKQADV